ncbi:MAG: hypothetical protein ACOCWG_02110 [bacterium]
MKISGFTFGKNLSKLYYPYKESILSILPIVDEFVIALGDSENDDDSRRVIEAIKSHKIKIIDTRWDIEKYPGGTELAHQTDIAKQHCSGDWLFYIQGDEVMHEKYLDVVREKCSRYLNDKDVEGLLFDYVHFWGDYEHYHKSHCWYRKEIRVIKNDPDIHSWRDAQSFRKIPGFDGINYMQEHNSYKLKVVNAGAEIYHYGWVRPPRLMNSKVKAFNETKRGKKYVEGLDKQEIFSQTFDYGPLDRLPRFKDTHPSVMNDFIKKFDWKDQLRYQGKLSSNMLKAKHDKSKYRVISWIENNLLMGNRLGEFKNYTLLKK